MLKKTIKYTDYLGNEREEDFYFNLTRTELTEWTLEAEAGDMEGLLKKMMKETDTRRIRDMFKDLILRAYGEVSPDGRRFIKNDGQLAKEFVESPAYDELFISLFTNQDELNAFIKGIVPKELAMGQTPAVTGPHIP